MLTAEYKTALAALTAAQVDLKGLKDAIKALGADAALLGASMLPPPAGTAADIASLAVSLGRGDWGGALWDVVGLIPIVGDGAKAVAKGSKVTKQLKAINKAIARGEKIIAKKKDDLAKLCKNNRVGKANTRQAAKESDCQVCNSGGKIGVKNVGKTPTYKIGDTDGGPGVWSKETTPAKGADYQGKVTGAPKDTEYVVETSVMKSGRKKFDGYDPERNVLTDAKDWKTGKGGWPVEGQKWSKDKVIKEASEQAKIGKEAGAKVEWHVPTQEKASELRRVFKDEGINVGVKVTPKN